MIEQEQVLNSHAVMRGELALQATQLIKANTELVGVTQAQARRYATQGTFIDSTDEAEVWFQHFQDHMIGNPGTLVRGHIVAGPGGNGKTHALGEAAGRLNFNRGFIKRAIRETGKPPRVYVLKMALTAAALGEMRDLQGRPLVENPSHSWSEQERARILFATQLAIERASSLSLHDDRFIHGLFLEWIAPFVDKLAIGPHDFVQFRGTNPLTQAQASDERDSLAVPGTKAAVIYGRTGAIMDKNAPSEVVGNRMGNREATRWQTGVMNRRFEEAVYRLQAEEGVPFFSLDRLEDDPEFRNEVVEPAFYRMWARDWNIPEGHSVYVPNTYEDGTRVVKGRKRTRGYWFGAIEAFALPVRYFVSSGEIKAAVG